MSFFFIDHEIKEKFSLICLSRANEKERKKAKRVERRSRRTDEINLLLKITRHLQETASEMEKQFLHDIKAARSDRRRREKGK